MNKITLREATVNDLELILAWRSIPAIYEGLYQQSKSHRHLNWNEHWNWWNSPYRSTWKIFIVEMNDTILRDIGYINIGQLDSWKPQIAVVIGELGLWGQGYGTEAVNLGCNWLKDNGYEAVWTTVLKSNLGSIRLFEKAGFTRGTNDGREGEWEYEKRFDK